MQQNGRTPQPGNNSDGSAVHPAPSSLLPSVLYRLGLSATPAQKGLMPVEVDAHPWYARAAALRALAKSSEQASLEQLLAAMDDEHEMVRAVAIHTAGLLGTRAPFEKIVSALQDPAWHVREVAALTLASAGKRVPAEPLIVALNDRAAPVRAAVRETLQKTHPHLVVEPESAAEESSPPENGNEVTPAFSPQPSVTFWQPEKAEEVSIQQRLPISHRESRPRMETIHPRIQPGKPRSAYFTTIAAVACLVLLVGSLLLTFNLVQRSRNAAGGQPVITDTTPHLYVTSANSIFKLDLASGKVIWKYTVTDYIHNKINPLDQETIETPVIAGDGMIFFEAQNHYIYALYASNGKLVWRKANDWGGVSEEINGILYITAAPAGDDSIGDVFALNARDGSERWHYQTQRAITGTTVANGRLYLTEYNHLEALNAANGAFLWKTQVPKAAHDFFSEPQVVNNILYMQYIEVYAPPGLPVCYEYAFDPVKGIELWHSQRMDGVTSPVTIANEVMYFGSEKHLVYALSARDGHQLWKSDAGGSIESSPQVTNGVVYVGQTTYTGDANHLMAFDATNGMPRWSKTPPFFGGAGPNDRLVINNGLIYYGTAGTTEANVFDSLHVYVLRATDGSVVRSYKITGANPPGNPVMMIAP